MKCGTFCIDSYDIEDGGEIAVGDINSNNFIVTGKLLHYYLKIFLKYIGTILYIFDEKVLNKLGLIYAFLYFYIDLVLVPR
jgi:hypothetical protein